MTDSLRPFVTARALLRPGINTGQVAPESASHCKRAPRLLLLPYAPARTTPLPVVIVADGAAAAARAACVAAVDERNRRSALADVRCGGGGVVEVVSSA